MRRLLLQTFVVYPELERAIVAIMSFSVSKAPMRSVIVRGASFARGAGCGVRSGAVSGATDGASGFVEVRRRFGTAVSVIVVRPRGAPASPPRPSGRTRASALRERSLRLHRVAAELVPERGKDLRAIRIVLA